MKNLNLNPSHAWPFEFILSPRQYQLYEFLYHGEDEYRHLFWTMRSGKSKTIVDSAAHLWNKERIQTVVIFTRKGLHTDWVTQHFPTHCPIPFKGFIWHSRLRKRKPFINAFKAWLGFPCLKVLAFNNAAIRIRQGQKFLTHVLKNGPVMVVADESSDHGSISSYMTRLLIAFSNKCEYRRILSGTHIGNSPLRLYTQFQILKKGILGFDTFGAFKKEYAIILKDQTETGKMYERIEGYKNLEKLQAKIEKFGTILRKKDLPELPKLIHQTITVSPSEEQIRLYRLISHQVKAELLSGVEIPSMDIVVQLNKLQQILSNFYKDEAGTIHTVDPLENPRVETLIGQVQLANEKCIVWCRYLQDIEFLSQEFRRKKIPFVVHTGKITDEKRQENIFVFQRTNVSMVFLATPSSVGLGKNLSAADTIYWYSKSFDAVEEQQANERATVIGSKSIGVVTLQVPHSIDTYIQKVLNRKEDFHSDMQSKAWKQKLLEEIDSINLKDTFLC